MTVRDAIADLRGVLHEVAGEEMEWLEDRARVWLARLGILRTLGGRLGALGAEPRGGDGDVCRVRLSTRSVHGTMSLSDEGVGVREAGVERR
jgi:hypothetical protein